MARPRWLRSFLGAVVGAAVAAAAQLGLGFRFNVITFSVAEAGHGAWLSGLAWVVWIAATSVTVGVVIGRRLCGRADLGRFVGVTWRLVLAFAASLGALAGALPLVFVLARRVTLTGNHAPELLASVYATAGVVAGLVAALLAVAARAIATNVLASAVWLWALGVVAFLNAPPDEPGAAQLAIWRFTDEGPIWRSFYVPGALLLLGASLLVGGLAAFPAAVRGDGLLGVAVSGGVGPALVLVAYELTRPTAAASFDQLSAAAVAPFMVGAGMIGSVLVAAVGAMSSGRSRRAGEPDEAPVRRPAPQPANHPISPTPVSPPVWPTHGSPAPVTGSASVPPGARAVPDAAVPSAAYQGGLYGQRRG